MVLDTQYKISRWKEILFHGYFIVMFVLAFQFYKERLYADSAYYIFNTIDSGFFLIPHQRLVLILGQIVPLICFYTGATLKQLLVAWSLGHVLYYYIIFLIAFYKFKNETAALSVILLNVIGQTWLYFSPMYEICYGAALLVLFKILLDENKLTRWWWFWLIILEIFVITSQPENFVIFFFVVVYDILKNEFRKYPHVVLGFVFIATIIFKTQTFSEYEGGKIHFMTDLNQNHLYENLWNKEYLKDLWKLFSMHYIDLMILFSGTLLFLISRKKLLRAAFLFSVITGLLILINATNPAHEFSRYNESLYYPLVSVIVIAFVFEVYGAVSGKWKTILLTGCCMVGFVRVSKICANGNYLSLRNMQMEELIRQAHEINHLKCVVKIDNAEKDRWSLNWSYPIESMLLSSMVSSDSTVSLVADEDYENLDTTVQLTENRSIIRRWEIRDNNKVLPFFKFRKENYFMLNTVDTVTPNDFFADKLTVDFNESKAGFFYDRIFFSINLKNISGKLLSSLPVENCFIKTSCEQDGKVTESQIPLDIDLHTRYMQLLSCPIEKGSGEIAVTAKLFRNGVELASADHKFAR